MSAHEFVAYIDESGDDGLGKYRRPGDPGGASTWLVISCCMVRAPNDGKLVVLRDDILKTLPRNKRRDIHFKDFTPAKKRIIVKEIVRTCPVRMINVLSCKKHIPDPAVYRDKNQLYWYLSRYLIERISWFADWHKKAGGLTRIVFSNRGGCSYTDFQAYLTRLSAMSTKIEWRFIDIPSVSSAPHASLAGLQFADCTARAYAEAVEMDFHGKYCHDYAHALKRVTFHRGNNFTSYGVKLVCKPALLDAEQRSFVDYYKK